MFGKVAKSKAVCKSKCCSSFRRRSSSSSPGSVLHELQYGHAVTPEFEAKTEALLKSMDMWDCRNRHPFSLSGGQMQRLTLMMAYLSDKPIVILDEPTAGQDAESLERCAALIREMRKEKTVLIITHDPGANCRCV